jgi:hypothetical protein
MSREEKDQYLDVKVTSWVRMKFEKQISKEDFDEIIKNKPKSEDQIINILKDKCNEFYFSDYVEGIHPEIIQTDENKGCSTIELWETGETTECVLSNEID